ncbi:MAG: hypothetical protein NTY15_09270 [Planctomycetota bacterium]|nr:hypothetical protein [Planctomycetota bacterium]
MRLNRECDGSKKPGVKFAKRTKPQVKRVTPCRALKERHNESNLDRDLPRDQSGNAVALRLTVSLRGVYHGFYPWLSTATAPQFNPTAPRFIQAIYYRSAIHAKRDPSLCTKYQ